MPDATFLVLFTFASIQLTAAPINSGSFNSASMVILPEAILLSPSLFFEISPEALTTANRLSQRS